MDGFDASIGETRGSDALERFPGKSQGASVALGAPKTAIYGATGRYVPEATGKGAGVGVTGTADMSGLAGQLFVGPYNIGNALRTSTLGSLGAPVWAGAAANILVTGWILNVTTARPSPFDTFGLLASAVAQIGFGMFLSPLPVTQSTSGAAATMGSA